MRMVLNWIDKSSEEWDTKHTIIRLDSYMQLRDMKPGQLGRITHIHGGEKVYRHRLISMGLIPGTAFTISRIAPLGDPIELIVRGFSLSLRKNEASILQVEEVLV